ncbi:MAG: hypothetical protein ACKO3G_05195 [Planctomycetaceae bacterium]
MRRFLRRALLRGVTASIVLPILLAIVLGLGALLAALGDRVGAAICVRVAQGVGVAWLLAVVATALAAGIAVLDDAPPRHGGCAPRGPGPRRGGFRHARHRRGWRA